MNRSLPTNEGQFLLRLTGESDWLYNSSLEVLYSTSPNVLCRGSTGSKGPWCACASEVYGDFLFLVSRSYDPSVSLTWELLQTWPGLTRIMLVNTLPHHAEHPDCTPYKSKLLGEMRSILYTSYHLVFTAYTMTMFSSPGLIPRLLTVRRYSTVTRLPFVRAQCSRR